MRSLTILLSIAALVAAIFIFYTKVLTEPDNVVTQNSGAQDSSVTSSSDSASVSDSSNSNELDSGETESLSESGTDAGFEASPEDQSTQQVDQGLEQPSTASSELNSEGASTALSSNNLDNTNTLTRSAAEPNSDYPELYGYDVAQSDLTEEDFVELVARLKNDPFLVNELLNELRTETDPQRLKRLSALLGETGSADILPVVEELVYSSSSETRTAGLDLLSRIAPTNPAAYTTAVNILENETDAGVLVSTMNVLASPSNASSDVRANAITQIMPLAEHESEAVRRQSVSLLSRLTGDQSVAPVLYNALADSDASVRSAATYAFARYPHQPPQAVERLLELTENPDETDAVRRGAIYALEQGSPSADTVSRISDAKIQMRDAARAARLNR